VKKILVTGGAGYIGSHTVVELVAAGFTPVIIDNFCNSERYIVDRVEELTGTNIALYEGDCNDLAFLKSVFEKEKDIKGAIHFAAYKAVGESVGQPLKYYSNNVGSTVTLIEALIAYNAPLLVFSSSCTVYGQPDVLPVTEETPRKEAESPYGNTKKICEDIISDSVAAKNPLKAISLRYFNPVGAHPSSKIGELPLGIPNNLVPYITQTAAGLRNQLTVFGDDYNTTDGTCIRDYIHVVDLAKAHVKALEFLAKKEETSLYDVFNVGVGKGFTVMEVINAFQKTNDKALNYTIGPRRSGDIEKIFASVDKATKELGWTAEISLEESMRDSWNWQKTLRNE